MVSVRSNSTCLYQYLDKLMVMHIPFDVRNDLVTPRPNGEPDGVLTVIKLGQF